ncbi:MAG: transposase, partial [Nostocoides sp.]
MSIHSTDPVIGLSPLRVQVGIDAAVVANHHVCVREILPDGQVRLSRFTTAPTLAGLDMLSDRLRGYPGVVAVAEPTSMTWLALSIAMRQAGGDLSLLGARHAARLRGAIIGKDKSDVIDADVLATAGEVFT